MDSGEELLRPGVVAAMFGVNPKTITRWAEAGVLRPVVTAGGHRRYRRRDVAALMNEQRPPHGGRG